VRKDLTARFGAVVEEHFAAAQTETVDWSRQDYERAAAEGQQVLATMSSAHTRGISPTTSKP